MKEITEFSELLSKNGKVNTSIIRRDEFKDMAIYKRIFDCTEELNKFDNIKLSERILFLTGQYEKKNCPRCGLEYYYFKRSQNVYRQCNHRFNINVDLSKLKKQLFQEKIRKLIKEVNKTPFLYLSQDVFNNELEIMFEKPDNYGFLPTKENFGFLHDVLLKTKNIIEINESDLKISERMYIIKKDIHKIPSCKYCGKTLSFINRKRGYRDVCGSKECIYNAGIITRKNKHKELIDSIIDSSKYEIIEYPEIFNKQPLKIKCLKCGHESIYRVNNGRVNLLKKFPLCKKCENNVSRGEEELYEFIKGIYDGDIVHGPGSRKIIPPFELDIYLPNKNIAFEYDGLYYHNDNRFHNTEYHLNKTKMCKAKGICLIHIFEDEWLMKKDIVKSRISSMLGIYKNKIFGRCCDIQEISPSESNKFMKENHLDGETKCHINIGLFYKGELVSSMAFCRSRFKKKYEFELLRYASKRNTTVIGGASKILKYFEKKYKPKSIVTYVDLRWSIGRLFHILGFMIKNITKPNYYYTDCKQRYSKTLFQKQKLNIFLDVFNENKTIDENMQLNGYCKIYDCGNMVFAKEYY